MGENSKDALRVVFEGCLKLEFPGSKVTTDAGLLVYRELDDAVGLTTMAGTPLQDWRIGKNTEATVVRLLPQSIYSRLTGNEGALETGWKRQNGKDGFANLAFEATVTQQKRL